MTMPVDIAVPYTTRPSMTKRMGPAFVLDPDQHKLSAKKQELAQHNELLWGSLSDDLVVKAAAHCGKPLTHSIVELALNFQEDLAIMHQGRLSAVCFCFPSGWTPRSRLGLTLAEIHQPVADGEALVSRSAKLAQTMADPVLGRFQRQVWTVTVNSGLSNLPVTQISTQAHSIDDLYFRWETQTTEPLGDGTTSLFFVDVNVVPLRQVWAELGSKISASVDSMTDAVLTYKNLHQIKTILNSDTK